MLLLSKDIVTTQRPDGSTVYELHLWVLSGTEACVAWVIKPPRRLFRI